MFLLISFILIKVLYEKFYNFYDFEATVILFHLILNSF